MGLAAVAVDQLGITLPDIRHLVAIGKGIAYRRRKGFGVAGRDQRAMHAVLDDRAGVGRGDDVAAGGLISPNASWSNRSQYSLPHLDAPRDSTDSDNSIVLWLRLERRNVRTRGVDHEPSLCSTPGRPVAIRKACQITVRRSSL